MALSGGPYLFCEGEESSLDDILLNNIVGSRRIEVKPLGGKYGFADRIDGYLRGLGGSAYIALRDRDLDYLPPDKWQLVQIHPTKPVFATYRACIESYLVDADLIHAYWVRFGAPLPRDEIARKITDAARSLADYQAVRWGLASIKPSGRQYWPRLQTTWEKNGKLPVDLSFDKCLRHADDFFRREYTEVTANMRWEVVNEQAHAYRERFQDEAFYGGDKYLVWFHGKDLLKAVFTTLNLAAYQISQDRYEEWSAQNIDLARHDDLLELRQKCQELLASYP